MRTNMLLVSDPFYTFRLVNSPQIISKFDEMLRMEFSALILLLSDPSLQGIDMVNQKLGCITGNKMRISMGKGCFLFRKNQKNMNRNDCTLCIIVIIYLSYVVSVQKSLASLNSLCILSLIRELEFSMQYVGFFFRSNTRRSYAPDSKNNSSVLVR